MKENNYGINPLQSLSNISGLHQIKDEQGRNKRRKPNRRPAKRFIEDERDAIAENDFENIKKNDDEHGIDYCA